MIQPSGRHGVNAWWRRPWMLEPASVRFGVHSKRLAGSRGVLERSGELFV